MFFPIVLLKILEKVSEYVIIKKEGSDFMSLTDEITRELSEIKGNYNGGYLDGSEFVLGDMLTGWVSGRIEPRNKDSTYLVLCENKAGEIVIFQHATFDNDGWNEEIWIAHKVLAYKEENGFLKDFKYEEEYEC